jgi:hypothetical protein
MVRMLAGENATQRGSAAAACLDAVAALSKVVAYRLLRWENHATIPTNVGNLDGISHAECRGRLLAGDGIGQDCVGAFAPAGAFSRTQIEENIAVLKDSRRMATIIAEAGADFWLREYRLS